MTRHIAMLPMAVSIGCAFWADELIAVLLCINAGVWALVWISYKD